ncbi:hypothetical protein Hanom_Chr12g01093161 [Helianthus anomalus]
MAKKIEEIKARARATKAEGERDDLAIMNANLIANAILDAPENTDAVAEVVGRAREARYKVGYTECLAHVNVVSVKKFTDERCTLCGADTDVALSTATEVYDGLIVHALAHIEECLGADDYVDSLRTLFEPGEMLKVKAAQF